MNFTRFTGQFQFFNHLSRLVAFKHDSSSRDPKIDPSKVSRTLVSAKAFTLLAKRTPKTGVTKLMLRRILQHPLPHIMVLDKIGRAGLEAPKAQRYDQRVFVLQDLLIPPVVLDPGVDKVGRRLVGVHLGRG